MSLREVSAGTTSECEPSSRVPAAQRSQSGARETLRRKRTTALTGATMIAFVRYSGAPGNRHTPPSRLAAMSDTDRHAPAESTMTGSSCGGPCGGSIRVSSPVAEQTVLDGQSDGDQRLVDFATPLVTEAGELTAGDASRQLDCVRKAHVPPEETQHGRADDDRRNKPPN